MEVDFIGLLVEYWVVVSFEGTHHIECRYTFLLVDWDALLHLFESTTSNELVILSINFCILVVHTDFMENMVFDSFGMYHESALSQ